MSLTPHEDEEYLLHRIAGGDQRAFTKLFDAYYKPLGAYVLSVTRSLPVTEEIIQEVFIKIWLKRADLTSIDHFTNYLFILCRNKTYDALRKIAGEQVRKIELEKFLSETLELEYYDDPAEKYRALIEKAVELLPTQQRTVFRLSRYDRLKYDEIAEQLNISPETVKKHLQAALATIRKSFKETPDGAIICLIFTTPLLLGL